MSKSENVKPLYLEFGDVLLQASLHADVWGRGQVQGIDVDFYSECRVV